MASNPLRTSDIFSSHDLLPGLLAFVVVIESGGYSAGARRARTDKATLSRRVRGLEDALKVRLLDRTTRTIRMTDVGRHLFDRAAVPLRDVLIALRDTGESHRGTGRVRITTVPGFADDLWAPVLTRLQREYPGIEVSLASDIAFQPLVSTGFDIGIRTGYLPETGDVATKLATWRYMMVASPAWIEANPDLPGPTADLPWLINGEIRRANEWCFARHDETRSLRVVPAAATNDFALLRRLAVDGAGVYVGAPTVVHDDLRTGRLVRAFPEWRVDHTHKVYAVVPHREYPTDAVRQVLDAIAERMKTLEAEWHRWTE